MLSVLALAARHAKVPLVLGLVAGIALPGLADALKPHIGLMVAVLLFLAALRVGPRQAIGSIRYLQRSVALALLLQLALPLAAIMAFQSIGWTGPVALGLILMLAASPVTGSPNLTVMTGNDPSAALRQLVVGTGILPLTVIPAFWLWPDLGQGSQIVEAAAGLLAVIATVVGAGFGLRELALRQPSASTLQTIDGLSAVTMGVVVIGLMSAVGPALMRDPADVAVMLLVAFGANLLLQIGVATACRRAGNEADAAALGIAAGNRNIALFLTVLPLQTVESLLLFIGCYQIPMYLTPTILEGFYRRQRG